MVARKESPKPRTRGFWPPLAPHPERLRIKKLVAPSLKSRPPRGSRAFRLAAGPLRAIPGSFLLRTTEQKPPAMTTARRLPSRVPHNATDERFIHLVCACYLVFWLTSAINRIVKEQLLYGVVRESTPQPHSLFTGPHRYHRPVQAARRHPAPAGMIRPQFLAEGKLIVSMASRRVKPPGRFFSLRQRPWCTELLSLGAPRRSCSVEECGRFVVVGQVQGSAGDSAWSQRQGDDASRLVAQDGTEAALEYQFAGG